MREWRVRAAGVAALVMTLAFQGSATAVDFEKFEGRYRGVAKVFGDPGARSQNEVSLEGTVIVRIQKSGAISCEGGLWPKPKGTLRYLALHMNVDEDDETVTIRPAFPFWMENASHPVAPFEIIRRNGDLIFSARYKPPPGSPMKRAEVAIWRDGDEFELIYVVTFDDLRHYRLDVEGMRVGD